jgi:hypothetical protein
MINALLSIEEASRHIAEGRAMIVAGDEAALARLPRGRWIGGTAAYFMTEAGGVEDRARVFCTELPEAIDVRVATLAPDRVDDLVADRFPHGFSAILIPAFSEAHRRFAMAAATIPGVFDQPLIGWIAGVHLDDLGRRTPKVFDGAAGAVVEDGAVVLHVSARESVTFDLDIVNLFTQGDDPAGTFVFPESGFAMRRAVVQGREVELGPHLRERGFDLRLPLVADYAGAMINVSIKSIDDDGLVRFYAPVIEGVEYRTAAPVGDYVTALAGRCAAAGGDVLSYNCILNYLHGGLAGRRTGGYTGPVTFGEIAYMLLNQTLVRLRLEAAE